MASRNSRAFRLLSKLPSRALRPRDEDKLCAYELSLVRRDVRPRRSGFRASDFAPPLLCSGSRPRLRALRPLELRMFGSLSSVGRRGLSAALADGRLASSSSPAGSGSFSMRTSLGQPFSKCAERCGSLTKFAPQCRHVSLSFGCAVAPDLGVGLGGNTGCPGGEVAEPRGRSARRSNLRFEPLVDRLDGLAAERCFLFSCSRGRDDRRPTTDRCSRCDPEAEVPTFGPTPPFGSRISCGRLPNCVSLRGSTWAAASESESVSRASNSDALRKRAMR